jgi:hypothetical protein
MELQVADLHWAGAVRPRSVPQLPADVVAPGPGRPIARKGQAVMPSGCNSGAPRQVADRDRHAAVHRRAIAQLAPGVAVPRFGRPIVLQGQAVSGATRHGDGARLEEPTETLECLGAAGVSAQGGSDSDLRIVPKPLHPVQVLVDCIVQPAVSGDEGLPGHLGQGQIGRIIGSTVEADGQREHLLPGDRLQGDSQALKGGEDLPRLLTADAPPSLGLDNGIGDFVVKQGGRGQLYSPDNVFTD